MSTIHDIAQLWQDHHLSPSWALIQDAVLEYDAEREESKRWMAKAHSERDARMAVEAELERIRALEPRAKVVSAGALACYTEFREIYKSGIPPLQAGDLLYAMETP